MKMRWLRQYEDDQKRRTDDPMLPPAADGSGVSAGAPTAVVSFGEPLYMATFSMATSCWAGRLSMCGNDQQEKAATRLSTRVLHLCINSYA